MPDCVSTTRRTHRPAPPSVLERPPDDELPLQLALGWVLLQVTPANEQGAMIDVFSRTFVADILAVIATEALEVNSTPATFGTLRTSVDTLVNKESVRLQHVINKRREKGFPVSDDMANLACTTGWLDAFREQFRDVTDGGATIDLIERDVAARIGEDDGVILNNPEPLERLSPLGLYFRALVVKLRKLGFNETGKLSGMVATWCEAGLQEYSWETAQDIERRDPNPFPETRGMTRISHMEQHMEALATGDFVGAQQALVAFYDYRAQMGDYDDKMAPHTLLNLSVFHYRTGGMEAAREAVEEAIRIARRANDADALQQALNLQHRLTTESEGAAWPSAMLPAVKQEPVPLRRLMHGVTPADDLWSLAAALDMGEPVPVAFRRIYTALGRATPLTPSAEIQPLDPGAWHAAQANLWALLGSESLASLHEDVALADAGPDVALQVSISRAERMAQRGAFEDALALLLGLAEGLDHAAYRTWTRAVWATLARQVALAQDTEADKVLRGLHSDSSARFGPGGPARDLWEPSAAPKEERGVVFAHKHVMDTVKSVRAGLDADPPTPPHLLLPPTLASLELSAGLGLWPTYRAGVVCLADVLLGMDLPRRADTELEAVWDELVAGHDALLLARGALARAKAWAFLAMGGSQEEGEEERGEALARASEYADLAAAKAREASTAHVLAQTAILREMLAEMGAQPGPSLELAGGLSDTVRRVGEVMRLVGVRVAQGWK
ncbi:hypothetical protein CcaverHIS002_0306560 [Cutaneotrichosporon cavernicola]|uniref:Anaphase-promoting complex subunit 5 n=1 Tax=Cutaneotrichosporon cavernicola TaxID=279322 RepID=A0AA48I9Z8_9TREE|nr:uncharacterized protein CcaverHIS019_0306500 [Cutaneotrichosporon cavernicola]BEI82788.1 hypothetical protein CcaverHIS002_0306560 [Cutaneotrichosporon cavernicola]BEI90580.1 hypothetical protein CcaverHIS019_0306500 [Cutaneotrichosporon cavernicola]BEI98356.1 hypothetical protein CcaverHIS631_0306550 [Cutaneotrichosporon cavernicola]BEJ06131.1 hypothetical protein CcaverHIS641_0306530 [Cutaneotrichosporon cavernicola]